MYCKRPRLRCVCPDEHYRRSNETFDVHRSLYVEIPISTPVADENEPEHGRERNLVLHFQRRLEEWITGRNFR